jgi:hypothetical protein
MNALMAFLTSASGMPGRSILPAPYLPYEWARWAYVAVLILGPALICLHAWMVIYHRRHHMPPPFMLRFWLWRHSTKPGKRMIGAGRHRV